MMMSKILLIITYLRWNMLNKDFIEVIAKLEIPNQTYRRVGSVLGISLTKVNAIYNNPLDEAQPFYVRGAENLLALDKDSRQYLMSKRLNSKSTRTHTAKICFELMETLQCKHSQLVHICNWNRRSIMLTLQNNKLQKYIAYSLECLKFMPQEKLDNYLQQLGIKRMEKSDWKKYSDGLKEKLNKD
ncbi:hypothetical protein ABMX62_19340 [Vibrio vulnificus]|uniref:hypothetical protein n=1 Tax=Vibrio vulnificus TaxID=672 RepID=UPI00405A1769